MRVVEVSNQLQAREMRAKDARIRELEHELSNAVSRRDQALENYARVKKELAEVVKRLDKMRALSVWARDTDIFEVLAKMTHLARGGRLHVERQRSKRLEAEAALAAANDAHVKDMLAIKASLEALREERDHLKHKVAQLEHGDAPAAPAMPDTKTPTAAEIRAAGELGVTVSKLRTWALLGIGPRPPYEEADVQSYIHLVEAGALK